MYFLTKAAMEDICVQVGDTQMAFFNEWWSYHGDASKTTTGRPSKKDCIGARELLKNKHEAQLTKSVGNAVSSNT